MWCLRAVAAVFAFGVLVEDVSASAFVAGAYYRLGDQDPGAVAGGLGADPTLDSFREGLDLSRFGSPKYSSDVPPRGPVDSKLSMAFANVGLGGPAFPSVYGRSESLTMEEQGYALEMWVKAGPLDLDGPQGPVNSLLAYNGNPNSNGFGFFQRDENYVARVGVFERVLGPATVGEWHHLAYVKTFDTAAYFFDGKLVAETQSDPIPQTATDGVWLGGFGDPLAGGEFLFNGWMDEVRYQSFNPLAAGAFAPTAFLIYPAGDVNRDGVVNIYDINLVSSHWGESGPAGDANGDMIVNIFDINLISSNWTPTGGSATPVPEPASWLMVLSAAAACLLASPHFSRRVGQDRVTAGVGLASQIGPRIKPWLPSDRKSDRRPTRQTACSTHPTTW
jgi:Concanavalin A-like lectin/glucanases superfamily